MIAIDMEMPKSCAVCPMNDDNCWCAITDADMRADYDKTRLDDCPLIDLTQYEDDLKWLTMNIFKK